MQYAKRIQIVRFILRHLTGGFSLAAQWTWGKNLKIICHVEIDPFCQKVLKKHWPQTPIISNIKELTFVKRKEKMESIGEIEVTTVDLLTGGFP